MRRLSFLTVVLTAALSAGGALADDRAAALAAFERAKTAEERLDLADAARLYGEAAAADPSAPVAGPARERARWLAERSDDDYGPLSRLLAAQRDPHGRERRGDVERLEQQALSLPSGRVRTEMLLFCASAWSGPLQDPARAVAALEAVVSDRGADAVLRRLALRELVALERARGGAPAAAATLERWHDVAPAGMRAQSARELRRPWLRGAAWAVLSILAAAGAAGALSLGRREGARAVRGVLDPRFVAVAGFLGAGGAAIAAAHGAPSPWPFLVLACFALCIAVSGRAWASAPGRLATTAPLRIGVCLAAVAAASFLSLDLVDSRYLEAFGL